MKRRLKAFGVAFLAIFINAKITKRGKVLYNRLFKHNSLLVKILRLFYDVRLGKRGGLRIELRKHNRG